MYQILDMYWTTSLHDTWISEHGTLIRPLKKESHLNRLGLVTLLYLPKNFSHCTNDKLCLLTMFTRIIIWSSYFIIVFFHWPVFNGWLLCNINHLICFALQEPQSGLDNCFKSHNNQACATIVIQRANISSSLHTCSGNHSLVVRSCRQLARSQHYHLIMVFIFSHSCTFTAHSSHYMMMSPVNTGLQLSACITVVSISSGPDCHGLSAVSWPDVVFSLQGSASHIFHIHV